MKRRRYDMGEDDEDMMGGMGGMGGVDINDLFAHLNRGSGFGSFGGGGFGGGGFGGGGFPGGGSFSFGRDFDDF